MDNQHQLIIKKLNGEKSPKESEALKVWLMQDKANLKEFKAVEKEWILIGMKEEAEHINIDAAWDKVSEKIGTSGADKNESFNARPLLKLVAGLALLIGLSALAYYIFDNNQMVRYTASAETYMEISLPDGSTVTLNRGSSLRYNKNDFNKNNRQLSLSGEAYFDVAKNPALPFVVNTQTGSVRVLGTAFHVQSQVQAHQMEVNVVHGQVLVQSLTEASVILEKGEHGLVNTENEVQKSPIHNKNFLAWKTKGLVFENDRLEKVLEDLEHAYAINFEVDNAQLLECRFTGQFQQLEPKEIMDILTKALGLKYTKEKRRYTISGETCKS